jgi:hypothetical protein
MLLSTIFRGIFQRGPGSPNENQKQADGNENRCPGCPPEFFFRSVLQLLLDFGNKTVIPESLSDIGSSDLAVRTGNGWVVMEIKHEHADPDRQEKEESRGGGDMAAGERSEYVNGRLEKMIDLAFTQIHEKHYAEKFLAEGSDVYAAAAAVYGTSVFMVRFRKVVWTNTENT